MASDSRFKGQLPSIRKSLSDHQFLSLKIAVRKLGLPKQDLENSIGLLGLYSLLTQKFPRDAASLLYLMLERVGCPKSALEDLELPAADPGAVKLEDEAVDLVLTTASIVNDMSAERFESFKEKTRKKFLPKWHTKNVSSPEKLFAHLFDEGKGPEPKELFSAFPPEYHEEIKLFGERHDQNVTSWIQSVQPMNVVEAGGQHKRRVSQRRTCVWVCALGTPIAFGVLFFCALGAFAYYLDNPISSGVTTHYIYAPPNTQVSALIGCFGSLTKDISVSTLSTSDNFDISLYKIQQNRLQVNPVPLSEKTIRYPSGKLSGHFPSGINYYRNKNPIYTAEDGNVIFDFQVKATPDNACPLRLFVFNGYSSYCDFVSSQPPYRKIESYYDTSCLTGNQSFVNYTIPVNLQGNSNYFFGILYNDTTIGITVSANTSQYSTEGYNENCTLSTNGKCYFSASNFLDALTLDKPCLISQASKVEHENITVTVKSHVGGVYSGAVMIVVFLFVILVGVGSLIICVCSRCCKKQ